MKKLPWALLIMCLLMALGAAAEGGPIEISDRAGLEAIAQNPGGSYVLTADIDLGGAPWTPIPLTGSLDGNGHTIINLTVSTPGLDEAVTVDGNGEKYQTCFAALFSRLAGATVTNLNLLNVRIEVITAGNCFAAGLAGYVEGAMVRNCSVSGRVLLRVGGKMCGVAGLAGFGYGVFDGCKTDVELVLVDENSAKMCEEFLGGVVACGCPDIYRCDIRLTGYTSVHGYVHNGGIVGMYRNHTGNQSHRGRVGGNSVDARIAFFEDSRSRRAYCKDVVGETLDENLDKSGNATVNFQSYESQDFDTPLLPEKCAEPRYTQNVTAPTCTDFGYTTFACETCGYSYTDDFTLPAHDISEMAVVREPDYAAPGLREGACKGCGYSVQEEIPALVPVSAIDLGGTELRLDAKASAELTAEVSPGDAANTRVLWASSDPGVASVDENGRVTAKKPGQAVITCSSEDGFAQAQCAVQVRYAWWQWGIVVGLFGWIWY